MFLSTNLNSFVPYYFVGYEGEGIFSTDTVLDLKFSCFLFCNAVCQKIEVINGFQNWYTINERKYVFSVSDKDYAIPMLNILSLSQNFF